MWDKYFSFLNKNKKTAISLFVIILIAIFFRFYNYSNRWGLASDQARDAILVLQALKTHSIPLIGPFSASGPFVFGPYMYWLLMIIGALFPFSFLSFWVGLGIISVIMVLVMVVIGKEIGDKSFGILLGFFTAISTRSDMSTNLIFSRLAGFASIISVYFLVKSIKYSRWRDYLFLGLFLGIAMNSHFQAVPLVFVLPISIFFGKRSIKNVVSLIGGFIVPFIPLIIFDLRSHFYESTHLIKYWFSPDAGDLPTRWITYLSVTWPEFWRVTIGGNYYVAILLVALTSTMLLYYALKKKINKMLGAIIIIYIFIFILLRYFTGPISIDFTAFINPFILIPIVWVLWKIKNRNKYFGLALILVVSIFTIATSYDSIVSATNYSSSNAKMLEKIIVEKFPKNSKFSIYDYKYKNTEISLPLVLYLNQDGKISDSGIRIGVSESIIPNVQLNYFEKGRYTEFLYTLENFSDKTLTKNGWVSVDPSNVYTSIEDWYKN